ncbi:MAG: HEAT repeat domain-containing protein [Pirellulales bacterium]
MSSNRDTGDDEVDRLLRQARWPKTRGDQAARLGDFWRRIRVARRRSRFVYGGLAMAASVLLVAGILAWPGLGTLSEPKVSRTNDSRPQPRPAPYPSPPAAHPETPRSQPPADGAVASRDPNLYERVILLKTAPKPARDYAAAKAANRDALVDELIDALAADAHADVDDRLARLPGDLSRCERLLWKMVRAGSAERRLGAARLLARIGTPRSLPLLTELASDPATHEAAVVGLGRLAGDANLARLAAVEPDVRLRRQLLETLLARQSPEAVGLFLGFVNEPRSRSDALAVLAEVKNPPADALLAYLESPQHTLRLSAALALSRVSDPAVVERLCESVWGIGRQEALIALLLSRSEKATGCLNEARGNLYLVASVQAAEQQLHSLQIPRGGNLP